MIDLHTHILPGLDDGAQDMYDAVEMAEIALESGVDTITATPHSNQEGRFENYAGRELDQAFQELKSELIKRQIPLKLLPGMEIYYSEDIREKIRAGRLIGLNNTRTYLVEFPFDCDHYLIGECLEDILDCGGRPLIAHPERYACVQEYPALLHEWIGMGCLSQVNKGSFFGRFGRRAYNTAGILLRNRLITCVSSDAHSPYMRTTYMADIRDYLEERAGMDAAHLLLTVNPERILRGDRISPHGRMPMPERRFFMA